MPDLAHQHCISPDEGLEALRPEEFEPLLVQLDGWELNIERSGIERDFRFKDFYQTIAFVNATAWIANQQDHHPDLEVGYNRCRIRYSTHAVNGLSINDFICAARIDTLNR